MVAALLLSGGSGTRLGEPIPKQYIRVAGRTIFSYALGVLAKEQQIEAIYVVAEKAWESLIKEDLREFDTNQKFRGFVMPGETRQGSILNGLEAMKAAGEKAEYVLIHDAARPRLTGEDLANLVAGAKGHDGVIPVLPMKDTVYLSEDGRKITSLLNRSEVVAGQAPEIFCFEKYLQANRVLTAEQFKKINGSTEPAILAGMDIAIVEGNEENFKVTTPEDLKRLRSILE